MYCLGKTWLNLHLKLSVGYVLLLFFMGGGHSNVNMCIIGNLFMYICMYTVFLQIFGLFSFINVYCFIARAPTYL